MKLLFDQNLSHKLVRKLKDIYPNSKHVYLCNLSESDDKVIWDYAKRHNLVILTQDSDFFEKSLIFGQPPKVIWLKMGNTRTNVVEQVLRQNFEIIKEFYENDKLCCLEIY